MAVIKMTVVGTLALTILVVQVRAFSDDDLEEIEV